MVDRFAADNAIFYRHQYRHDDTNIRRKLYDDDGT